MKASTGVTVITIFLMLIAGVGFGIAQAGGTHTDSSAYGLADQESLQVVNAPEEDMDEPPTFVANAPEDMEVHEPIGVGTLPSGSNMDIDDTDSHDQGEYTGTR